MAEQAKVNIITCIYFGTERRGLNSDVRIQVRRMLEGNNHVLSLESIHNAAF